MANECVFILGSPNQEDDLTKLPGERIVFAGKSNVGKSSLINSLFGQRLAKVSRTPGKTEKIYFYQGSGFPTLLVDVPGYGYAVKSKTKVKEFAGLTDWYIQYDEKILAFALLIDSRRERSEADWEAAEYLMNQGRDFFLIFTKFDALKNQSERAQFQKNKESWIYDLGMREDRVYTVSTYSKTGIDNLNKTLRNLIS